MEFKKEDNQAVGLKSSTRMKRENLVTSCLKPTLTTCKLLRQQLSVKVFICTIQRAIKSMRFSNWVAAKEPFLSAKHKAKRLEFAKQKPTLDNIRVKECHMDGSILIEKNSKQVKVRRKPHKKFLLDCLASSFKLGRSSIWGAIPILINFQAL